MKYDRTVIAYHGCDAETAERLLSGDVRKDRFVEGHFAEMITRGHITVLLRRLGELAAPKAVYD